MLETIAADLREGRTTSRALTETCLAHIANPSGEGKRTFVHVDPDLVLAMADHADRMRAAGAAPPFAGIPISLKDLFDIAGQPTRAGSRVLENAPPAARDAPVVARLRTAGFLPIGRTTMTEFAFSGLGINEYAGTPKNPFDRVVGRIPGGSSSGAAVSVTDGMAFVAIGSDTGGSCRIPAALCGIVGYKPTQSRIPRDGVLPLSTTLDSIGPLAATVADCAIIDAVLAGEPAITPIPAPLRALRLAVPRDMVLDDMDSLVAAAFEAALRRLRDAGAEITELDIPTFADLPSINAKGGFSAAEALAFHRPLIATSEALYDPRVLVRILRGHEQEAADYIDLINARAAAIRHLAIATAGIDALIMPTVPMIAPPIDSLADDKSYTRTNALMLRNTSIANFYDGCAISLPCHAPGTAPVGLMLMGATGTDKRLFSIAAAIEALPIR
jgi:aspartyl-tRNA(Asn)/glutamyl-tRNA(Gln) amidotransferase subunit A